MAKFADSEYFEREMVEYADAREAVLAECAPRRTERRAPGEARGYVLAEDVVAQISSPPFPKSAMDGYAVRSEDVRQLPADLDVIGEVAAGQFPDFTVGPGQAAVIATGAPVPDGADTVVMVEHTETPAEGRVRVQRLRGANICPEGEDIREGQTVLKAGRVLTPFRIGVAASAGYDRVSVYSRPDCALLCTGNEVVEAGDTPGKGQIFNSNGPMLSSVLRPLAGDYDYLGIAGDDEAELARLIRRGLEGDVLVVTGGVSVGPYDLVPRILKEAGVRRVFHKVAIKPGKPTYFGVADGTLVFGMPGNPQSGFVIFKLLVEGALAVLAGVQDPPPHLETGVSAEGFANRPARMNVKPCTVDRSQAPPALRRCSYHGSADIVGPGEADGYLLVPRGTERVEEGQGLRFFAL